MNIKRLNALLVFSYLAVILAVEAPRLMIPRYGVATADTNVFSTVILRDAEAGNARAQYLVALQYARGFGRRPDADAATEWLTKASEQGFAKAQFELAERYQDEARDPERSTESRQGYQSEALNWYRKAAEQGLAEAQYNLGCALRFQANKAQGNTGLPFPVIGADYWEWWEKAAEKGHGDAAYYLAFDLERTGNYTEAAKWYKVAAASLSFHFSAVSHLAELYHDGRGVPQDRTAALRLAAQTAEGADPGSDDNLYFRLGDWYAEKGPLQNLLEAYKWFNIVAAKGHFFAQDAKRRQATIAMQMTREQIAAAEQKSTQFLEWWERRNGGDNTGPEEVIGDAESTGSGFFVTEDGYFCTCFHVVEKATKIIIQTPTGSLPAKLIARDTANDLAILKAEGQFSAVPVSRSQSIQLGDPVFTIGFPNVGIQGVAPKLTRGEISSLAGIQDDPRYFQISVPVQPGNSGGPLLDASGNVVGIVAMRMDDRKALDFTGALPQNVNYAVKSSLLLSLTESVPVLSGKLKRPVKASPGREENAARSAQPATALVLVY